MEVHHSNKRLTARFLTELAAAPPQAIDAVLAAHCHDGCHWEVFHPFNTLPSNRAAADSLWRPLKRAFPDYEQRIALALGGEYEGRQQVSTWGHVMGTFYAPWLGIPPTFGLAFLRFGFNAIVRDGKIAKAYVLLDIVDVMRQARFYPFRSMPGTAEAWQFPPVDSGATGLVADPGKGERTLAIIREMQMGLPKTDEIAQGMSPANSRHSHHWHADMNWYGPAGIGSMRGRRGFRDYHGALFLQAFPDRNGIAREPGCAEVAPGHYTRIGDGLFAVTGGWPSLRATHTGSEWLGLPPTGRKVEMRVADWYRLDADGRIADNWVMMDIPHIVDQMGLDIFHDLAFIAAPGTERWPI